MDQRQWQDFEHFNVREKWGNPEFMSYALVFMLEKLRKEIDKPFIIHCGYEATGHAPKSFHGCGMAVDFHVQGIGLHTAWEAISKLWWFGGLGMYPHWNNAGFHLDLGKPRRWMKDSAGKYKQADNV